MKYRKLTADGDYTFGHSAADFYADQPEAVAQAAVTRLRLTTGDWFLDVNEGTDWFGSVLGAGTQSLYAAELRDRIGNTQGVNTLVEFTTFRDGEARALSVSATLDTIYGQIAFAVPVSVQAPATPWNSATTYIQAPDNDTLIGPDGDALVGANDPNQHIYI